MKKKTIFILVILFYTNNIFADYGKAMNLFINKEYICAETELLDLIKNDPQNLNNLKLLIDVYISENKFKDAISTCKTILVIDHKNEIIINLARINSWIGNFDDSIKSYEIAIALKPEELDLQIEKARVLGWAGKQKEAVALYELIYNKFKLDWVNNEMLGKKNLWDHKINDAIKYLELCIKQNPKNPEVLFDVAQLYSYLKMHQKADKYYEMLIETSPYNSAGKKSFNKNIWVSTHPEITLGYSRWIADSKDRFTDIDLISNFIMVKKMFNDNYSLSFKYIKSSYNANNNKLKENMTGILFDYYKGLDMGAGAYFLLKNYDESEIKDGNNFTIFYWKKFLQNLDANISFKKENLLNNYNNIKKDLHSDFVDLKIDWDLNKLILLTTELKKGNISDNNSFFKSNVNAHFTLTPTPRNLYTELDFGKEIYKDNSINYFAPDDYTTYSGLIGFKHHFSPEGLFYGANDYYYNIFYKSTQDSNNGTSKQPGLILYFDFTQTLSLKLQYLETISYYYKDKSYSAMLSWYP